MSDLNPQQTNVESLEAELRTGSIDQFPRNIGIDFFDLYELDPERRALQTKADHLFHRGAIDADHTNLKDDFKPIVQAGVLTTDELFELNTPDMVSSKGRRPLVGASSVPFYPWRTSNGRNRYSNPLLLWNPGNVTETAFDDLRATEDPTGEGRAAMGFFEETENLVVDSEDGSTGSWVVNSATAVLGNLQFEDSRFTLLTGTGGASNRVTQFITSTPVAGGGTSRFTTSAAKIVKITLKLGTQDTVTVQLLDFTATANRLDADITFSTKTVAFTTGTLIRKEWYGDDIVVLTMLTTSITAANEHRLFVLLGSSLTTTMLFTRAFVIDAAIERPYVATTRAGGQAVYPFEWSNEGTIECWVRPFFQFDDTPDFTVFGNREPVVPAGDFMFFRYQASLDRFRFLARDSVGNELIADEDSALTNAVLQAHRHLKVFWSVENNNIGLQVNGVLQTTETTTGTGISAADFTQRPLLRIGAEEDTVGTMLITDFRYQRVVDTSTIHFDKTRPYFTANRQLGKSGTSRLDEYGNHFVRYPHAG